MRLQVNTSCTSRSLPVYLETGKAPSLIWLCRSEADWALKLRCCDADLLSNYPSESLFFHLPLLLAASWGFWLFAFQTALSPNLVLSLSTVKKDKEETGVFHFTWCLCRAGRRAVMLNAPSLKEPEAGAAELNWTAASSVRAGMEYYLFLGWMRRQEALLISLWLIYRVMH